MTMNDTSAEFKPGDILKINSHKSEKGEGLSYSAQHVRVREWGSVGGWDVYEGWSLYDSSDVAFYGFSVVSINGGNVQ
jgi:hypothetical protein